MTDRRTFKSGDRFPRIIIRGGELDLTEPEANAWVEGVEFMGTRILTTSKAALDPNVVVYMKHCGFNGCTYVLDGEEMSLEEWSRRVGVLTGDAQRMLKQ